MELADWSAWARMAAVLAAVTLLVWLLQKKMCPLITIAGVPFYGRDLQNLESFKNKIAQRGHHPIWFLHLHHSEILTAVARLGRCPKLLDELIRHHAERWALWDGIVGDCPELVSVALARPDITREHIDEALSYVRPGKIRDLLIHRWEEVTGKKWEDDPDLPPSRDKEYGSSRPDPSHGGSPEPTR